MKALKCTRRFVGDRRVLEKQIHQHGSCRARHRPRYRAPWARRSCANSEKPRLDAVSARASAVQLRRRRLPAPRRASARRPPAPPIVIRPHARDRVAPAPAGARHPRHAAASTIRPSSAITPLPGSAAKAARIRRPRRSPPRVGAKTRLAVSIWPGWIRVLPSKPKARAMAQAACESRSSRSLSVPSMRPEPCGPRRQSRQASWRSKDFARSASGVAAHVLQQVIAAQHQACDARRGDGRQVRAARAGVSIIAQSGDAPACLAAAMSAAPFTLGSRMASGRGRAPPPGRLRPMREDSGIDPHHHFARRRNAGHGRA